MSGDSGDCNTPSFRSTNCGDASLIYYFWSKIYVIQHDIIYYSMNVFFIFII